MDMVKHLCRQFLLEITSMAKKLSTINRQQMAMILLSIIMVMIDYSYADNNNDCDCTQQQQEPRRKKIPRVKMVYPRG